jgi:hypothetical protein
VCRVVACVICRIFFQSSLSRILHFPVLSRRILGEILASLLVLVAVKVFRIVPSPWEGNPYQLGIGMASFARNVR